MTLELIISTIDDGIHRVARLPLEPAPEISYLVSWQHSAPGDHTVPEALRRPDVRVVHLDGRGLSRNRNNCLRHAAGDICLVADDDCRYTLERLRAVVKTFADSPGLDLAAFRMESAHVEKRYPPNRCRLGTHLTGYAPTSFELAFRRASVQGRLRFNEHFGLGAPLFHCAEEEIFVHDALLLGLRCEFVPTTIVVHDHPTSDASRVTDDGNLMARGAFLYIGYRGKMLLYPFPIARRLHRRYGVPFGHTLAMLYKGLFHILRHPSMARAGLSVD